MRQVVCLFAVCAAAQLASATPYTAYLNEFDTLDGVSVRCGTYPTACCENLRLEDGGAVADVTTIGYAIMDIDMDPNAGIDIDPPIDFRYGEFTVSLEWYSEWYIPDEVSGFWLRVYSRVWDEDESEWVFSGGRNFFYEVEQAESGPSWQTFTRDVDDYDETDWGGPFDPTQVYKFRIDSVVWSGDFLPYSFGIDHFELIVPECPEDLDGDDAVLLSDLAYLLSEYGCMPVESTLYDTGGFEGYTVDQDLVGQDGWETLGFTGTAQVVSDPTGSGMGNVVILDAADGTGDLVTVQRLLDTPITDGVVIYEWDQYRPDFGDNVWLCDDFDYDGWWAIQWDSADPLGQTSPAYWAGGAPLTLNTWNHVRYEINLNTRVASVQVDGGDVYTGPFSTDDMKGVEFEIEDTAITGNGPIYLDNVLVNYQNICPVDYDGDGMTFLSDLATLLGAYLCGATP